MQIVAPLGEVKQTVTLANADEGIARVMPAMPGPGGDVLVEAVPRHDPSDKAVGPTIDRLPVALRLLGRWAWWLPKPLDRLLPAVRFGHA